MKNDTLISVIVITYNSSQYIIETLESIKEQTYKNIELIISDDGSTDETIILARKWIEINKNRFVNHIIVESKINTGITKNCNRGAKVAKGDYIKFVAGDDLLLNNCIEDLFIYCVNNNLKIVFSKAIPFYDDGNRLTKITINIQEYFMMNFFKNNNKQQYKKLLRGFRIGNSLIGCIIKKDLFFNVGGFNEKYVMMEDYPFIVKVSSLGYKLYLLNKYTVKYRVHSLNNKSSFKKTKRYKLWLESLRMFEMDELLPRMKKEKMFLSIYDLYIRRFALKIYSESNNDFIVILSKIIRYLSPFTIKNKIVASILKIKLIYKKSV